MYTIARYDAVIPTWAIPFLAYGDSSGLSDRDVQHIEGWLSTLIGGIRFFDYAPGDPYFSHRPEFGLPCDCLDAVVTVQRHSFGENQPFLEAILKTDNPWLSKAVDPPFGSCVREYDNVDDLIEHIEFGNLPVGDTVLFKSPDYPTLAFCEQINGGSFREAATFRADLIDPAGVAIQFESLSLDLIYERGGRAALLSLITSLFAAAKSSLITLDY